MFKTGFLVALALLVIPSESFAEQKLPQIQFLNAVGGQIQYLQQNSLQQRFHLQYFLSLLKNSKQTLKQLQKL